MTERATGLGRRTRGDDIEKWDQTDNPHKGVKTVFRPQCCDE